MSHEQWSSPEQSPLEPAVREAYLREWAWHIEFILASYEREEAYPKPIAATLKERFKVMADLVQRCTKTNRLPAYVKSEVQFGKDVTDLAKLYGWMRDLLLDDRISSEALEELAPEEAIYDLGQRDRLARSFTYSTVGPFVDGVAVAYAAETTSENDCPARLIRPDGSLVFEEWFHYPLQQAEGIITGDEVKSGRLKVFKNEQPLCEDVWFNRIDLLSEGYMSVAIDYGRKEGRLKLGENYLKSDGSFLLTEERAIAIAGCQPFSEGRAWITLKDGGGEQLLDEQGDNLLPTAVHYGDVRSFKNGMALVRRAGQVPEYVFVDRQGELIRDFEGEVIAAISYGRSTDQPILPVVKTHTCYLYDIVEKRIIWQEDVVKLKDIYPFNGGIALVEWKTPQAGWSCVKRDGTLLETSDGRKVFQNVKIGEEGLISVKMDDQWFLFNVASGQVHPDGEGFDEMGEPQAGMVGVKRGETTNFLRKDGSYRWPSFLPFTRLVEIGEGMTRASNFNEEHFFILRPDGTILPTTIPLPQEGNDFPRFEGGICHIEFEEEVYFLTHAGRTVFSQE